MRIDGELLPVEVEEGSIVPWVKIDWIGPRGVVAVDAVIRVEVGELAGFAGAQVVAYVGVSQISSLLQLRKHSEGLAPRDVRIVVRIENAIPGIGPWICPAFPRSRAKPRPLIGADRGRVYNAADDAFSPLFLGVRKLGSDARRQWRARARVVSRCSWRS